MRKDRFGETNEADRHLSGARYISHEAASSDEVW